jgi:hypothetical protein
MRIVGLAALAANVLTYGVKTLTLWRLTPAHLGIDILVDAIGVAVGLITAILAPVCLEGWRMIPVVFGSLVLSYLWFCWIAWWALVK